MCTPAIALPMMAASAASSAVGSYYSAQGQQSQLRLQADMDERQAQAVLEAGERDVQRSRLQTAQLKGTQRASIAANGIDLGEGSAARVLTSTDLLGEVDAQTIHANAIRNAWGYRTDATLKRASASSINPLMSAATSLIGGSGRVAESWYRLSPGASPINGSAASTTISGGLV